MHLQEIQYLTFDLKITRNVAQYPLHHVTYSATKSSNGLGGDTFTINLTDGQTDDGPTLVRN